ncbi:aminotransferase class IV [Legionella israelensis]|uniref:Aminodeoxychorismate lyase n=1 Tax=Legionella israelensis TaxID=454 RepID=A0A0W0WQD7_9GAMM|nr:aminotransferase class IV [Legionella israelensis]KTD34524.1 4-amino-4-deoxychorismate lyase [Legionella israelensis]QBS09243.1 4-amino-4-deoxychorismate lyase [Legionella israelensis]SCX98359.1 4-amino-4-deoxychorismate lyase [Legionella israelensis DSM 19235]STX58990.1 4-amino-4-deoxychorismate lyase [Legionella israelensis]
MSNGIVLDGYPDERRLSIRDRIFLGEGLFETIRVTQARSRHAELHWQRLARSAKCLGMKFDVSLQDWKMLLQQHISQEKLQEGALKVILTGGIASRGLTKQGKHPQLLLQTFQYARQKKPMRLISSDWLRDARNPMYGLKTINYLEAILARRKAMAAQADDVLFYNTVHHVTETSCANVFLIQQNKLFTPPLADGVLPGITRQRVIAACINQNISCTEKSLTQQDIGNAEVVFLTNTLQDIQSVCSIDELVFSVEHPLLEKLENQLNKI